MNDALFWYCNKRFPQKLTEININWEYVSLNISAHRLCNTHARCTYMEVLQQTKLE